MRFSILSFYFVALISTSYCRPYYGNKEGYVHRPNSAHIKEQLIEFWSRPEVLIRMPEDMRYKVMEYIKQNPQFRWMPDTQDVAQMKLEREEEEEATRQEKYRTRFGIPPSSPPSEDEGQEGGSK